jgi:hypothetical protein
MPAQASVQVLQSMLPLGEPEHDRTSSSAGSTVPVDARTVTSSFGSAALAQALVLTATNIATIPTTVFMLLLSLPR